ncbi:MAG: DUF1028 domain-containing protein [Planctomycetota bacterium]
MRVLPSMRSFLASLFALVLFACPAAATWSIVIVDLATGEVAIGIATCLTGFDLRPSTVVVVPGYGVAAAQSFVGPISLRELVRDGFLNGETAQQILAQLAAADPSHQSRQYGIVSMTGGEATFTGAGAGGFANGITGQVGTLRYAIQGNVITGQPVLDQAELAIQNTVGTLGDKLMAAMEAARSMGGDGRCSCSPANPPGCGSPPASFNKSAHIGLMIVSRPSDVDAPCNGGLGCGAGDYWMDLNVANQSAGATDPVVQLQALYQTWKQNQLGRPDHFESVVTLSAPSLRANGQDTVMVNVDLRDAAGTSVGNLLPLDVALAGNSTVSNVEFGPVVALANGTYEFAMRGNLDAGVAVLDIGATDSFGRVGLWPRPTVTVEDVFGACGAGAVPDGAGGVQDVLTVNGTAGTNRTVEVGFSQPFTLSLDAPQGAPGPFPVGMFALWLHAGIPLPAANLPIGGPANTLCFTPDLLLPGAPTALVADSFGLGGAISAGPAPWNLAIPGLPVVLDAGLQGVMVVDGQGTIAATNAVLLRLRALPAPVLDAVDPRSPTAGQLVTVTGSDFFQGLVATVDGVQLPITLVSPTQATFVAPANLACDAQLELGNPGGASSQTPLNPTPLVTSLPITSGSSAGGGTFFVIGQFLEGATVTIGGAPLNVTTQSATVVVGSVPPGTPGAATVVVSNPTGCQATATYTYL